MFLYLVDTGLVVSVVIEPVQSVSCFWRWRVEASGLSMLLFIVTIPDPIVNMFMRDV